MTVIRIWNVELSELYEWIRVRLYIDFLQCIHSMLLFIYVAKEACYHRTLFNIY